MRQERLAHLAAVTIGDLFRHVLSRWADVFQGISGFHPSCHRLRVFKSHRPRPVVTFAQPRAKLHRFLRTTADCTASRSA